MRTLIGPSALSFSGLVTWYACTAMTTTAHPEYSGTFIYNCYVLYLPDIDEDEAYIRDTVQTMYTKARRPTPERCILDYIRHLDVLEESYLVEGLREYVDTRKDLSLLREVA